MSRGSQAVATAEPARGGMNEDGLTPVASEIRHSSVSVNGAFPVSFRDKVEYGIPVSSTIVLRPSPESRIARSTASAIAPSMSPLLIPTI